MSISTIITAAIVGAIFGLFIHVIAVYNFLNSTKVRIKASIQEIGNQLKRQAELIPNLANATKGYMEHEQTVFTKLTDARKSISSAVDSGDVEKMLQANEQMMQAMPAIRVVLESNPELKASDVVKDLMRNLTDTSDKVSYARRLLIDLTADYNQKLVVFPSNIIANMFGFKPEVGLKTPESGQHIEVSESDTVTPQINI
ncbi:MAG: LemA family protein [bacterium]|nr:LemA family protein [bacterium]